MKVKVIDLNGSKEYQRLLGGKPETHGMKSGRVYLRPGDSVGEHNTNENEEIIVFLSGSGELVAEGKSKPVGKGKVSYAPPDTIHNVRNTGKEPLVYIFCISPAGK